MDFRRSPLLLVGLCFVLAGCGEVSGASDGNSSGIDGQGINCEVTFGVAGSDEIKALDYEIALLEGVSVASNDSDEVDCTNLLPNSGVNVAARNGTLDFARVSVVGFQGPVTLDRCKFVGANDLQASDFTITVMNASSGTDTLDPPPLGEVIDIDCSVEDTPTSTTTTTLSCGGRECAPSEICVDGVCTETTRYEIDFSVADDRTFGSLQLDVDYSCDLGGIVGSSSAVECKLAPGINGYAAFQEDDGNGECDLATLQAGTIFPAGIVGPGLLFTCEFEANGETPRSSDFDVKIVDTGDRQGQPIAAASVVASVRPAPSSNHAER